MEDITIDNNTVIDPSDNRLQDILDRLEDLQLSINSTNNTVYTPIEQDSLIELLSNSSNINQLLLFYQSIINEIELLESNHQQYKSTISIPTDISSLSDSILNSLDSLHYINTAAIESAANSDQFFSIITNRIDVLDWLLSELEASRMIAAAEYNSNNSTNTDSMTDTNDSNPTNNSNNNNNLINRFQSELIQLCTIMNIPIDSTTTSGTEPIKPELLLSTVLTKLTADYSNPELIITEPLFNPVLFNSNQLTVLQSIHNVLTNDYSSRRELLIDRLSVTIASFLWANNTNNTDGKHPQESTIKSILSQYAPLLTIPAVIEFNELFTSGIEIIQLMNINSSENKSASAAIIAGSTATGSSLRIKQQLIGPVPDRGGRTDGSRSNQSRSGSISGMPEFKPRSADSQHYNNRGGGHQHHRGGSHHNNNNNNSTSTSTDSNNNSNKRFRGNSNSNQSQSQSQSPTNNNNNNQSRGNRDRGRGRGGK